MSTSSIDVRAMQSKADGSVLELLGKNLRHAETAFATEKAALEAARARYERAEEELASVQARFDGYATIVSEQRDKMRKFPALSTEILCCIFAAACPPHRIDTWSLNQPTPVSSVKQRSITPFCLSAVCRRWRTVATTLGSLWNLIAIPDDEDDSARASRIINYIATISKRSKTVDLAVIIGWNEVEDIDEREGCARIIATLAPLLRHVVSLELHVGCCGTWMDLFRRPTPRLETLFCMVSEPSDAMDDAPLPRYLPIAPKLETLRLEHVPLVPQSPLPALNRLAMNLACVSSDIIATIFANAPTLGIARFTLISVDVADDSGINRQIAAPCLTALYLASAAARILSQPNITWQFPRVTRMGVDITQIDTAHPFLAVVRSTLTAMFLYGPGSVGVHIAEVLRPLAKLQTLLIRSCVVADEFWRALCKPDDILLPALAFVTLDDVELAENDDGTFFEHGDGLIQFVRERRRGGSTTVIAGSQLKTVRSVTIKHHGTLSAWLVDEINYIMDNAT